MDNYMGLLKIRTFYSPRFLAMISLMISCVPPPMGSSRASRERLMLARYFFWRDM